MKSEWVICEECKILTCAECLACHNSECSEYEIYYREAHEK